jgi:hypothetical protein
MVSNGLANRPEIEETITPKIWYHSHPPEYMNIPPHDILRLGLCHRRLALVLEVTLSRSASSSTQNRDGETRRGTWEIEFRGQRLG